MASVKQQAPDDAALAKVLGPARAHWDALLRKLDERVTREWKFYGEVRGWQLKVLRRKKALLYLIPRGGRFTAAFPLSEPAFEAVRGSDLPAAFITEVEGAKKYPEGRPARIDVSDKKSATLATKVLELVLAS